ncbi:MAG: M28 family peptidase [Planctomycetota bacterium]
MTKLKFLTLCILPAIISSFSIADENIFTEAELENSDSITEHELRSHMFFLASEELEGRATGEQSIKVASKYIESEYTKYALSPYPGQKNFFQEVPISKRTISKTPELSLQYTNQDNNKQEKFVYNKDYSILFFSGSTELNTEIVFAGYGITAPEFKYDDYAGIDVKGKAVLVLRYTPQYGEENSPFKKMCNYAFLHTKYKNAIDHGAVAFLLVTGPKYQEGKDPHLEHIVSFPVVAKRDDKISNVAAIHISPAMAQKILANKKTEEIEAKISKELKSASFPIKDSLVSISIKIEAKESTDRNVISYIEGSDPNLKNELIIIGAHYDHLGKHDNKIFFGANDNSSGTTCLLEIAEGFSLMKEKPSRSLMFIAFTGEEVGLIGSSYYVQNPLVPLKDTVFMVNIDMVGTGKGSVFIGGGNLHTEIEKICKTASTETGLKANIQKSTAEGSDHNSFISHNIPALFIVSSTSSDYHTPQDTADKIDFQTMTKVARMVYLITNSIANLPERPEIDLSEVKPADKQ